MNNIKPRVLVHLHLYYHDQIDYMISKLKNIVDCDWDLYVTVCENNKQSRNKLLTFKPDTKIIKVENLGYDVLPFWKVLQKINLSEYDYVLKIHTKNFREREWIRYNIRYIGYDWRNDLIEPLLDSEAIFRNCLSKLKPSQVGMVCSTNLIGNLDNINNLKRSILLCKHLKIKYDNCYFACGTMFMIKASVLEDFKNLKFDELHDNQKQVTGVAGTIDHAMEKVFGCLVDANNLKIVGVDTQKTSQKRADAKINVIQKEKTAKNVIVSLTTYPARINTVYKTILTLLYQVVLPEKIILTLGEDKFPRKEEDLPQELKDLLCEKVEINWTPKDMRSYTKLIPIMKKYPKKIIVTADDDILYPNNWLEKLHNAYLENPKLIHCHRIHRVTFENGKILPYNKWLSEISNIKPSFNNFLTGVGGALYPPNCLYKDIVNKDLFTNLCPLADDIWFWAMAVLKGTKINVIKDCTSKLIYVEGSQEGECLWKINCTQNQNDVQLQNVLEHYPQIYKKLNKSYFDKDENNFLQNIFSVKNNFRKTHKIVTILGIKFKFKSKKLLQKQGLYCNSFWENIFSVKNENTHKVITILGMKIKLKSKKLIKRKTDIKKATYTGREKIFSVKNINGHRVLTILGIKIKLKMRVNFSVIMPTYNRAFCIEKAIDSLLNQTYRNFELIIIDDCSTDNTEQLLKEKYSIELLDKRIIYKKLKNNKGVSNARNVGLKLAKYEWITYLDSDNEIDKQFLEHFGNTILDSDAKCYYAQLQRNDSKIIGKPFNFADLCKANYIDIGVFVHHKSLVKKYGKFDTKLKRLVDWDLIIRYTRHNEPCFIKKVLLQYNNTDYYTRITNTENLDIARNYIYNKINNEIKKQNIKRIFSLKNIFSVRNESIHKVVTILGLKLKFKSKKLIRRQQGVPELEYSFFERIFSVKNSDVHKIITILGTKYSFKSKKLVERKRIEFLENNLRFCSERICSLDSNIKTKNSEIKDLNTQIDSMTLQVQSQDVEVKNLINKNEETTTLIKSQNDRITAMSEIIEAQAEQIKIQLETMQKQTELIEKTNLTVADLNNKIQISEKELEQSQKEISNCKNIINSQNREFEYKLCKYMSPEKYPEYLKDWYKRMTGETLDLDNPQTFNERIQWLKLYDSNPLKTRLADKYLVRDWVKEKIGEEYLIPLLGVWDNFDDINFDELPDKFVLKCNHGSGYNIIVKDKSKLDIEDTRRKINNWMNEDFAYCAGLELHYHNIEHKIIAEQYLDEINNALYDYRFFCSYGKCAQIWLDIYSGTPYHKRKIYDRDWNELDIKVKWPKLEEKVEKPSRLSEMIQMAEYMSKDFSLVRVDFYYVEDNIYFGEMTFTSMSGIGIFEPKEAGFELGQMIKLPIDERELINV